MWCNLLSGNELKVTAWIGPDLRARRLLACNSVLGGRLGDICSGKVGLFQGAEGRSIDASFAALRRARSSLRQTDSAPATFGHDVGLAESGRARPRGRGRFPNSAKISRALWLARFGLACAKVGRRTVLWIGEIRVRQQRVPLGPTWIAVVRVAAERTIQLRVSS